MTTSPQRKVSVHQNSETTTAARRPVTPRRAALVLVAAVLGAAGGWFAAGALPPQHTAEATVLLNPLEGNAFRPGGNGEDLVNLQTEAEVMRSDAMAVAVADAMTGVQDPAALLSKLEATVVTNTQILQIAFTARNQATAQEGAQTFAEQYLLFRSQRAEASLARESEVLDQQITQREDELDTLAAELATAADGSPQATLLSARLQTVTAQLTQLSASRADLAATTIDPGQIVANATPLDPGPLTPALLLPIVGAVLTAGVAAAMIWLRVRARSTPLWPAPPSGWPRIDWGYRGYAHPAHAAPVAPASADQVSDQAEAGAVERERSAESGGPGPADDPRDDREGEQPGDPAEPTPTTEPSATTAEEPGAATDGPAGEGPADAPAELDLFEAAQVSGGKTTG